jgi:hypothetical protein
MTSSRKLAGATVCWMVRTSSAPEFFVPRHALAASENILWPGHVSGKVPVPTLLGTKIGYSGKPFDIGPIRYVEKVADPEKKVLPVMQVGGTVWAVSSSFRAIVDRIEPGTHEFVPIDIIDVSGRPSVEQYFLFNVCRRLAGVDLELSQIDWRARLDGTKYPIFVPSDDRFSVRESVIKDSHIWRDDYFPMQVLFCSDLVKQAFDAARFEMLEYIRVRVERAT